MSLLSRIIYNSSCRYLSASCDISASFDISASCDISASGKFPIDFCIVDNLISLRPYDQVTIFHMKSSIRYILQSSINSIQILANSSTIFDIISLLSSRIIYNSSCRYLSASCDISISCDISASGNILRCKFPIDFCISDNLISFYSSNF